MAKNNEGYEDYTDKIITLYVVDDLEFTPTTGDSAGKTIKYKRLAIDIEVGSKTRRIVLKPQDKSDYEFLAMAESQE